MLPSPQPEPTPLPLTPHPAIRFTSPDCPQSPVIWFVLMPAPDRLLSVPRMLSHFKVPTPEGILSPPLMPKILLSLWPTPRPIPTLPSRLLTDLPVLPPLPSEPG